MVRKNMFIKKDKKQKNENYDRVMKLHEQAAFLFYVNDAYEEKYEGKDYMKLEGIVAKGEGHVTDIYELFDCNGKKKSNITMEELYLGTDKVELLRGGDKRVALYPKEQDVDYRAGDILCIFDI